MKLIAITVSLCFLGTLMPSCTTVEHHPKKVITTTKKKTVPKRVVRTAPVSSAPEDFDHVPGIRTVIKVD